MYNYISQTEHHKQTRGSGHHLDCSLYNSFHTLPNWQSNCLWFIWTSDFMERAVGGFGTLWM